MASVYYPLPDNSSNRRNARIRIAVFMAASVVAVGGDEHVMSARFEEQESKWSPTIIWRTRYISRDSTSRIFLLMREEAVML